jgi:hypothetical protein
MVHGAPNVRLFVFIFFYFEHHCIGFFFIAQKFGSFFMPPQLRLGTFIVDDFFMPPRVVWAFLVIKDFFALAPPV